MTTTTKANNALQAIAKQMATHAAKHPFIDGPPERLSGDFRHRLPRGLRLALYCGPTNWHLSIIREKTPPSPIEARTIRQAFNVPDWAVADGPHPETITKPGRGGWAKVHTYYIINISWNHKLEFSPQPTAHSQQPTANS